MAVKIPVILFKSVRSVIPLLIGISLLAAGVFAEPRPRVVHVYVALADNKNQGIVPVPSKLGNGQDAADNLYWGAAFGVKSYFKSSGLWKLLSCGPGPKAFILERCVFEHRNPVAYLVADAYDGARIRKTVTDFLDAAAGKTTETLSLGQGLRKTVIYTAGGSDLVAYVGHDAFMDFQIPEIAGAKGDKSRQFIVLACASRPYFRPYMRATGSAPLLWTTGLMAPEAYTLEAALEGWLLGESGESVRQRAARAYDKYQKCGLRAAQRLFVASW
jgi:hypothetical protein